MDTSINNPCRHVRPRYDSPLLVLPEVKPKTRVVPDRPIVTHKTM